jgi:hypothetical protein
MRIFKTGAAALAIATICATGTSAAAADEKVPGAFLQCDGRVGHVTDGARFIRLLLVTATAGISETAMSRNNADKRVKGVAAVAACDQALASEGDGYRRMQLALARALHFGEDKRWADAAAAAQAVPQYLGAGASDWALAKSATSTAHYLQALYLVRAGRIAEGEATAWEGVKSGGLDVLTLQRMGRFRGLSRTMTPDKRAALEMMQRYYPDSALMVANTYAEAGDYKAACEAVRGFQTGFGAFLKEQKPATLIQSMLATFDAMDGNLAGAKSDLEIARTALERDRGEGDAASDSTGFAAREDNLAFAEAAVAEASGDHSQAVKILRSRASWPTMAQGVVAALVGRVASNVPEAARTGVLVKSEAVIWKEGLDARLAVLRNTEKDEKLWSVTDLLEQDEGFQRLARNALTGSGKSKWLVKSVKEPRDFDVLAAGQEAAGWEAGEGILYHAALMAKARGKQGFVLLPKRDRIDWVGLRFVDQGELGIPSSSIVMADDVIAALSPHIRAEQ